MVLAGREKLADDFIGTMINNPVDTTKIAGYQGCMDENKPKGGERREIFVKPPDKREGGFDTAGRPAPDMTDWAKDPGENITWPLTAISTAEGPPPDLTAAIKTLQDLGIAVSKAPLRPKAIGYAVQIRMGPDLLKRLDKARGGRTRPQAIRAILERGLPHAPD